MRDESSLCESSSGTALTLFVETDPLYDDMLASIAAEKERVWPDT